MIPRQLLFAITNNEPIKIINLNEYQVGDTHLILILQLLEANQNGSVKALYLKNCELTDVSGQALIEFVINNKQIVDVCIENNFYTSNIKAILGNALDLNRCINQPNYVPRFRALKETTIPEKSHLQHLKPGMSLAKSLLNK